MTVRLWPALGVLLAASIAPAATVTLPSTLDQLIAAGTSVTVGDKTFSNFSVAGPVAAKQISIIQAPGSNVGIEFGFTNFSATDGESLDTVIRYQVHVDATNTSITGVNLHFDGSTNASNTSPGNSAAVTETISTLGGTQLGQISVFNAGPNLTALNHNDATFSLSAPTQDLLLAKDISVHSLVGSDTATINLVDNTFDQSTSTASVPLPPAFVMGFSGMAMGALALIRRRLSRI